MHELVKLCREPFRAVCARTAVTVREADNGYIIRSDRAPVGAHRRDLIAMASLGLAWIAGIVMWVAPQMAQTEPSVWVKLSISALLLVGTLLLIMRNRSWGHFVIRVDIANRMLGFGIEFANGSHRNLSEARFGQVSTPLLRRGVKEGEKSRLLVKIAGQEEPMLVATGDELTLLAIHDRLVRDLRPIEKQMSSFAEWKRTKICDRRSRQVFPALGPSEIAV